MSNDTADFKNRVRDWAERLRVKPSQIRVQSMPRKWASCSRRGWVTFSADLLEQAAPFQDYVIVHELLHLRIRNHGKLFHATLRSLLSSRRVPVPKSPGGCLERAAIG